MMMIMLSMIWRISLLIKFMVNIGILVILCIILICLNWTGMMMIIGMKWVIWIQSHWWKLVDINCHFWSDNDINVFFKKTEDDNAFWYITNGNKIRSKRCGDIKTNYSLSIWTMMIGMRLSHNIRDLIMIKMILYQLQLDKDWVNTRNNQRYHYLVDYID